MWPFKKKAKSSKDDMEPSGSRRPMRCGTALIWKNQNNPDFYIRSTYVQADGSKLIEDEYPYDGRREVRIEPP